MVVANSVFAAPEYTIDNPVEKDLIKLEMKKPEKTPSKKPSFTLETEKYFFGYSSALSLRVGAALNFNELNKTDGNKRIPMALGFNYMLKSENSKHQEYGFDLFTGSHPIFYARGGYKYVIDSTDSLRPYYKIGAALRFDPGDHIETPFDIKSYSLVGSIGIEDLTTDPHSLRVDLDIFLGKEDFLALCSIGWAYAF